jgi:hypothetical protein
MADPTLPVKLIMIAEILKECSPIHAARVSDFFFAPPHAGPSAHPQNP